MYKTNYAVAGGDMRSFCLACLLRNDGENVLCTGLENACRAECNCVCDCELSEIYNCDVLILPIPASIDGVYLNSPLSEKKISLEELFSSIKIGCKVFGGMLDKKIIETAEWYGHECFDYSEREEFSVKNAVATAEGAIGIAISELPQILPDCNILILGHGRIGRTLTGMLCGMGNRVSVAVRRESEKAWIAIEGGIPVAIEKLEEIVSEYNLIINTVPEYLLTEKVLKKLKRDALVIDLSSKPGGVDFKAAKEISANVIWALSLPGKTAPLSSGRIIKDTVMNILDEGR